MNFNNSFKQFIKKIGEFFQTKRTKMNAKEQQIIDNAAHAFTEGGWQALMQRIDIDHRLVGLRKVCVIPSPNNKTVRFFVVGHFDRNPLKEVAFSPA